MKASGALSELLQHEIDHLNGILATDRAIDGRSFAMRNVVHRQTESRGDRTHQNAISRFSSAVALVSAVVLVATHSPLSSSRLP